MLNDAWLFSSIEEIERMNMKKSKKWIVWTIMIVFVVGCLIIFVPNKKEVVHDDFDFWKETYDILAKKIGGLKFEDASWKIVLQDRKNAVEAEYPGLLIQYAEDENDRQTKTSLSMNEDSSKDKAVEFVYEVSEFDGDNLKAEKEFVLRSTDYKAEQFKTIYRVYEYLNGVFDRTDTKEGSLTIHGNEVDYDELPLMKEAFEHFDLLLENMENEFGVSYEGTNFIGVPTIEFSKEIAQDIQSKDYFSEVHYNAKGYGIVTFLMVDEDEKVASYGTYDVTRQGYGFRYDMTLVPRTIEQCFDLETPADIEKEMVYFDGERAYIYPADWRDEDILSDVNQGAENAVAVLSTQNKSYTDYERIP